MGIKTGIDLVYLPRFKKALKKGGEKFLRRIYLEKELGHLEGGPGLPRGEIEHLAGIFAAKEAVIKALGLPVGSWHDIHIGRKSKGAPTVVISNFELRTSNFSLSIAHDGDYVIAMFVAVIKK